MNLEFLAWGISTDTMPGTVHVVHGHLSVASLPSFFSFYLVSQLTSISSPSVTG